MVRPKAPKKEVKPLVRQKTKYQNEKENALNSMCLATFGQPRSHAIKEGDIIIKAMDLIIRLQEGQERMNARMREADDLHAEEIRRLKDQMKNHGATAPLQNGNVSSTVDSYRIQDLQEKLKQAEDALQYKNQEMEQAKDSLLAKNQEMELLKSAHVQEKAVILKENENYLKTIQELKNELQKRKNQIDQMSVSMEHMKGQLQQNRLASQKQQMQPNHYYPFSQNMPMYMSNGNCMNSQSVNYNYNVNYNTPGNYFPQNPMAAAQFHPQTSGTQGNSGNHRNHGFGAPSLVPVMPQTPYTPQSHQVPHDHTDVAKMEEVTTCSPPDYLMGYGNQGTMNAPVKGYHPYNMNHQQQQNQSFACASGRQRTTKKPMDMAPYGYFSVDDEIQIDVTPYVDPSNFPSFSGTEVEDILNSILPKPMMMIKKELPDE